jgi:hypothetical protein
MKKFAEILRIKPGTRVLDLGGTPGIWEHISASLEITLLNLPGALSPGEFEMLQSPGLRLLSDGATATAFSAEPALRRGPGSA